MHFASSKIFRIFLLNETEYSVMEIDGAVAGVDFNPCIAREKGFRLCNEG